MTEHDDATTDRPTILVVDDTPTNIDVLREGLCETYFVQAATSGRVALRIVERKHPDLILLDIMMPDMDGLEVCRRLKADPATHDIPIMFVTAKTDPISEVEGFDLGAVDYITKPVNLHRLKARVRAHIDLARARRRLAAQNEELIEAARLREDVDRIIRHDLKSPLTAIIGFPQLLMCTAELGEREQDILRSIETAGQNMLQMINSSLDLFKMERGVYELRPEPVELVALSRAVLKELARLADTSGVETRLTLNGLTAAGDATCMALGEPLLCRSLFGNLIKNAIEASPGGETVTVDLSAAEEAVVTIRNHGEVPADILPRFFDKFATSGKRNGTGLGTYSARLMAETLNGAIALDAATPGVTRVIVRLPRAG